MSKRRPTAHDRDIVDWLRKMKPGKWHIEVEDSDGPVQGFGLVPIKHEGSMRMEFDGRAVTIWPEVS